MFKWLFKGPGATEDGKLLTVHLSELDQVADKTGDMQVRGWWHYCSIYGSCKMTIQHLANLYLGGGDISSEPLVQMPLHHANEAVRIGVEHGDVKLQGHASLMQSLLLSVMGKGPAACHRGAVALQIARSMKPRSKGMETLAHHALALAFNAQAFAARRADIFSRNGGADEATVNAATLTVKGLFQQALKHANATKQMCSVGHLMWWKANEVILQVNTYWAS
jgi:hypothetical protein